MFKSIVLKIIVLSTMRHKVLEMLPVFCYNDLADRFVRLNKENTPFSNKGDKTVVDY